MKQIFTIVFLMSVLGLQAQDDLMKELEQNKKPETNYVGQTFKGTRIVNGQSVETKGKGELEFIFAHRFDKMNSGSYNAFGFDGYAIVRLGLEYGITDRLGVSVGRTFYGGNIAQGRTISRGQKRIAKPAVRNLRHVSSF